MSCWSSIFFRRLGKTIGRRVSAKGYRRWPYVALFVLMFIGGEFFGTIADSVVLLIAYGGNEEIFDSPLVLVVYGLALAGAAVGGWLGFLIANTLPPKGEDGE